MSLLLYYRSLVAFEPELISWSLKSYFFVGLNLVPLTVEELVPISVAPLGERSWARGTFEGLNFQVGAHVVHGIAHFWESFVALEALKQLIRPHRLLIDLVDLSEVLSTVFSPCAAAFDLFCKS